MKVQRFSQFQTQFSFPSLINYRKEYLTSFLETDLGRIYSAVPWNEMATIFNLRDSKKGPQSIFSPRGKIGLMFLKHHSGVSDKKLIDQLNANSDYQIFCDIVIEPSSRLSNYKIVSEIRCELAKNFDMEEVQGLLAEHWRPYCENRESITCDATCYESYVRYPTDIKLLYETVEWNFKALKILLKSKGKRMIRSKMRKWRGRYQGYSKSRRPSRKVKRALTRALLKLLEKIHLVLLEEEMIRGYPSRYQQRRETTAIILTQQKQKFNQGINPSNRVVSLDKPYLRPIVRGKEIKKVEFGAKVHKLQIDGISFIEHLSFDAFNEGTRLVSTVHKAQKYMHRKTKILGADKIYATNANRNYVSTKGISTDFVRKGRKGKHHQHFVILQKAITKERATKLEGSFRTDKEHFLLNRIKARTELTERLWIFFGIHTSNALKVGRRMAQKISIAA